MNNALNIGWTNAPVSRSDVLQFRMQPFIFLRLLSSFYVMKMAMVIQTTNKMDKSRRIRRRRRSKKTDSN